MTLDLAPQRLVRAAPGDDTTRPSVRALAVAVFLIFLVAVVYFRGWPQDYFSTFAWLWLFSVAWNIEGRPIKRLVFVRDWSLALALLIVYFYSREMADNLGMTVRYSEPIAIDKLLGFGDTPSARLQSVLCGSPCDPSSSAHWYDRVFIIVWMSHFTVGLGVAVMLWLRNRHEFKKWMRRYLAVNFVALISYLLFPTAPPWMASAEGRLPSDVYRLSARAWVGPRPDGVGGGDPAGWAGNAVAAMPSLHAAVAFLVALYAVQRLTSRWRWLFMLYPLTMSFALVYLGEHYVTDVLAGAACAAAVAAACTAWERRRDRRRALAPTRGSRAQAIR
jgi:membrane-associated phospholipid phosphatase